MAKANRSDLDEWNVDEQRQRQRAIQLELVEKLKRRQDAGETLLSQQEIDWFKGRPVTDEEMDELKEHIENTMTKNKHFITHEQLRDLRHYERMFANTAETVEALSIGENNDMQQGFKLGKLHSTLRMQSLNMLSLLGEITNQTIDAVPAINPDERQW